MALHQYQVTLSGENQLFMDRDNLTFTDTVVAWQKNPDNKQHQVKGDDRSPAWLWLGKLHYEDLTPERWVGFPVGMLQACLRDAAALVPHPVIGGNKTLKDVSQSGILFTETLSPILVHRPGSEDWSPVSYTTLYEKLHAEDDFAVHQAIAASHGCILDVRRASPQRGRKHVRVRPTFGHWRVVCHVTLTDDLLTQALLLQIFTLAGRYKGLGNWRPSNLRAGAYGTFSVTVE